MRVIIQRSKDSYVSVEGKTTGSINSGMVILVSSEQPDKSFSLIYVIP